MTEKRNTKKKTADREVHKPFLTGSATDERTGKSSLAFFGTMIVIFLVAFIACLSATSNTSVLRLVINSAVIILEMIILFNNGLKKGTEDVAKGEILWQKKEKGQPFSDSEQKICFHPLKGYLTGLIGTLIFIIPAVFLALNTSVQMTGAGGLPSWMQTYTRRSDIGNALVSYTQPAGMALIDYIRAFVRVTILPFVNLVGNSDRSGLMILERISPMILLLPAAAYGTGYLSGRKVRTQIHTAISENDRKRIRKEQKKRRERTSAERSREPEQLN